MSMKRDLSFDDLNISQDANGKISSVLSIYSIKIKY